MAVSTRWKSTLALSALVLAVSACGDSSGGKKADGDGGTGNDGNNGGGKDGNDGNNAGMDGGVKVDNLDDGVAGKACSSDKDCPGGSCESSLQPPFGGFGGGTATAAPGGYCTGSCVDDSNCGSGGTCVGAIPANQFTGAAMPGQCQKTCESESDCRDGYVCSGGFSLPDGGIPGLDGGLPGGGAGGLPGGFGNQASTCQPRPATGQLNDNVAGDACKSASDCGGKSTQCVTTMGGFMGNGGTDYPGGYCTAACLEDKECGAGGTCVAGLLGGAGTCYATCSADKDCTRDGYRCRTVGQNEKGCAPGDVALPDNTAGKACASKDDCGGATCATELPVGFGGFGGQPQQTETAPGGYCTTGCVEDGDCGAGGTCVGGIATQFFTRQGTCFQTCTGAADCTREGYDCVAQGGGGGGFPGGGGGGGGQQQANICRPAAAADAGAGGNTGKDGGA